MHRNKRFEYGSDGSRARLAEGSVGAVDVCDCGMMLLHVGAVTLRLSPSTASELSRTLSQALTAFAEQPRAEALPSDGGQTFRTRRCDS